MAGNLSLNCSDERPMITLPKYVSYRPLKEWGCWGGGNKKLWYLLLVEDKYFDNVCVLLEFKTKKKNNNEKKVVLVIFGIYYNFEVGHLFAALLIKFAQLVGGSALLLL